jgi:chemotaxis protein methyltransferase CheR
MSAIAREDLERLSELVGQRLGLHLPPPRWSDLARAVRESAPELGCADAPSCARALLAADLDQRAMDALSPHLTVGETWFFRHKESFAALEKEVLPALLAARRATGRQLVVWSAGCSTGEEPYSLAITLRTLLPDWADWRLTILGTDLDQVALARAAQAEYGEWSFRGVPAYVRGLWFTRTDGGRWQLRPDVRAMVQFRRLNLAAPEPWPWPLASGVDLILCRNTLIYFREELVAALLPRFAQSLRPDGWLLLGPVESATAAGAGFVPQWLHGALCYRLAPEPAPAWPLAATPAVTPLPRHRARRHAVAPAPAAAPSRSPAADEVYPRALALYQRREYDQAAALLSGLAPAPTTDRLLARTYANQGKHTLALELCDRALSADRIAADLHELRAKVLLELGRVDAAREAVQRALFLAPESPLGHIVLAGIHQTLHRRADAARAWRTAAELLADRAADEVIASEDGLTVGDLRDLLRAVSGG